MKLKVINLTIKYTLNKLEYPHFGSTKEDWRKTKAGVYG